MNVDTLVVFEGKRGAAGSLFETLLAIKTFCPKSVFIFYDIDYLLRNRSDLTTLKAIIRKACLDKKIKIDFRSMRPDNYHFTDDLKKLNFGENFAFLVTNGLSRLSIMTLINCCAGVFDSLDEKLIIFDKESRSFFINRKGSTAYRVYAFESADLSPDESLLAFQRIIYAALKQNERTAIFPLCLSSLISPIREEGCFPKYRIHFLHHEETVAFLDIWIDRYNLCYKVQRNQDLNEEESLLFSQTLARLDDNGLWDVIIS